MNEEEIIEFITNNKCYKDILEIHDKYYNMLLGRKIKFSFKSFRYLMYDLCHYYNGYRKQIIHSEFVSISNSNLKVIVKYSNDTHNEFNIILDNVFVWDIWSNKLFEEYGTTINESSI